uniref:OSJNBb0093G06.5 protein n=1 Tax=Oryza sativa subsp. japonica TaxID=39947 RepID=Q7XLR6_ORYSJ|nr:OSJNBb0093G06.5 [Oryza sativa Japonica Group]
MTDLFPDIIPQSNSGRDIEYAPGLIPNGCGPSPPVIGYHAPKTSSLLQGLIREPADAGKKRKTRASTIDPSAPAPKKKAKSKKTKPTDDLPALDPSIEQALDEEEIGEDVDQAAAEKKKTAVRKKSAATTLKPALPPPPPPPSPEQQSSSDQTPSAAGSHHVEEEVQPAAPAIPVLADMFSFDIKDYFDEIEEDTTSKALAPLSDDVRKTLEDVSHRLEASSLDSLVVDYGSIRTRLHEVQALIPEELVDVLTPAAYLEQHQFKLEKAKLRLAECQEHRDIEATIQANLQLVHEEKTKLDQLSEGLIKSNIDRLEARKIELLAQLQECNTELDLEHKKLADLPQTVEEQKARLTSAIKNVADMTKSLKVISGTDAQDAQAIEEVEQIRQRVISAIQCYLSR